METVNSGDTAWVLVATALVLMMTPALAFFYGGMVRKKNILSTLNLSFIVMALISVQWLLVGYSLAFGGDVRGIIGGLEFAGLAGVGAAPNPDYAPGIPHLAFAVGATYVIAVALRATMGLHVSENEEEVGLDISEHGERAYA